MKASLITTNVLFQRIYKLFNCEYCVKDGHTWKYCWETQANAKKARRLKVMDDRDDDPSDTFNSMVSEDPISDDDLEGFIRNFSEMTKLNYYTN